MVFPTPAAFSSPYGPNLAIWPWVSSAGASTGQSNGASAGASARTNGAPPPEIDGLIRKPEFAAQEFLLNATRKALLSFTTALSTASTRLHTIFTRLSQSLAMSRMVEGITAWTTAPAFALGVGAPNFFARSPAGAFAQPSPLNPFDWLSAWMPSKGPSQAQAAAPFNPFDWFTAWQPATAFSQTRAPSPLNPLDWFSAWMPPVAAGQNNSPQALLSAQFLGSLTFAAGYFWGLNSVDFLPASQSWWWL